MEAFWDTSSLVPLCASQDSSAAATELLRKYSVRTWWGSRVELQSALSRLMRLNQLDPEEYETGRLILRHLTGEWLEVAPSDALRSEAQRLLTLYPLKAADALQLAAAYFWADKAPLGKVFISGDRQLITAARDAGFLVVTT